MFITIIIFLAVLSLLVFVHEFGHFFSARKLGVKAEEFGFGFPPRIFGIYRGKKPRIFGIYCGKNKKWKKVWGKKQVTDNSDTIYSINAIPLGGFVKIKGQDGDSHNEADSFSAKEPWKRAIILSAGVIMNIVLASLLISLGLMIGFPRAIDKNNLPKSVKIYDEKIQIVQILPDSPALEAGLQSSDAILKIDGQDIKEETDIINLISNSQNESIDLIIDRSGEIKEFEIIPRVNEETGQKIIGVAFSQTGIIKYPWYQAIWEGIKMTGYLIWAIIYAFYEIFRNLIIGQPTGVEVAGPIGIADLTGQMARMGFIYLIQFTALLSINLAIINILPFPALDGGRLLFLLIEKIKRRPVKQEIEAVFHNLGFVLLMALVIWVTFKDILKLFN